MSSLPIIHESAAAGATAEPTTAETGTTTECAPMQNIADKQVSSQEDQRDFDDEFAPINKSDSTSLPVAEKCQNKRCDQPRNGKYTTCSRLCFEAIQGRRSLTPHAPTFSFQHSLSRRTSGKLVVRVRFMAMHSLSSIHSSSGDRCPFVSGSQLPGYPRINKPDRDWRYSWPHKQADCTLAQPRGTAGRS
jgi:hypothetical protein